MSSPQRLAQLYLIAMLPSSFSIGKIFGDKGRKCQVPVWKTFTSSMLALSIYPLSMPYLAYRAYKGDL